MGNYEDRERVALQYSEKLKKSTASIHRFQGLPDTDKFQNMLNLQHLRFDPSRIQAKEKKPTEGDIQNQEVFLMFQRGRRIQSMKWSNLLKTLSIMHSKITNINQQSHVFKYIQIFFLFILNDSFFLTFRK